MLKKEKKSKIVGTRKSGVPSRQEITAKFHANAVEALEILLELMRNKTSQDSVRVSAATKILDKVIPDVKAVELTGENKGAILIKIVEDVAATPKENE